MKLTNSSAFTVGVIAATNFDTNLGINLLETAGIPTIACCVSKTPQEQTLLQIERHKLQTLVTKAIDHFKVRNVSCVFIYCNSLSGLLNLSSLSKQFDLPIITPLSTYQEIAKHSNQLGLIAANGQGVANIERILLEQNKNCLVIGLGNLALVNAIEQGIDPHCIIDTYELIQQCRIFEAQGCQKILLACTHFSYFYRQLISSLKNVGCKLDVIEPSQNMLDAVLKLKT